MQKILIITVFARLILCICYLVVIAWKQKSKGSMSSKVTLLVLASWLFSLEIFRLVFLIPLGEERANCIFLIVMWAINVFSHTLTLVRDFYKTNYCKDLEPSTSDNNVIDVECKIIE